MSDENKSSFKSNIAKPPISSNQEVITSLRLKLSQSLAENERLSKELALLQQKYNDKQELEESNENENRTMKEYQMDIDNESKFMAMQQVKESKIISLQQQLIEWEQKFFILQQEKLNDENTISNLHKLNQENEMKCVTFQEIIQTCENKLTSLQQSYQLQLDEKGARILDLETQIAFNDADSIIKEKEKQLEQMSHHLETVKGELVQTNEALQQLQTMLVIQSKDKSELEQKFSALLKENQSLLLRMAQLEAQLLLTREELEESIEISVTEKSVLLEELESSQEAKRASKRLLEPLLQSLSQSEENVRILEEEMNLLKEKTLSKVEKFTMTREIRLVDSSTMTEVNLYSNKCTNTKLQTYESTATMTELETKESYSACSITDFRTLKENETNTIVEWNDSYSMTDKVILQETFSMTERTEWRETETMTEMEVPNERNITLIHQETMTPIIAMIHQETMTQSILLDQSCLTDPDERVSQLETRLNHQYAIHQQELIHVHQTKSLLSNQVSHYQAQLKACEKQLLAQEERMIKASLLESQSKSQSQPTSIQVQATPSTTSTHVQAILTPTELEGTLISLEKEVNEWMEKYHKLLKKRKGDEIQKEEKKIKVDENEKDCKQQ